MKLLLLFTWIAAVALPWMAEANSGLPYDYPLPEPGTYALPVIQDAADGEVIATDGRRLPLRSLTRDRVTVLSFIYTRCTSARACPRATGVLARLHEWSAGDRDLASGVRLVSLSFDPQVDTPDRMAGYAALARSHPKAAPWHFLTTASREQLAPILRDYGQAVDRKEDPRDPEGPLHHALRVFLVDREGRVRNIYNSSNLDARLVMADIRSLLLEGRAPNP